MERIYYVHKKGGIVNLYKAVRDKSGIILYWEFVMTCEDPLRAYFYIKHRGGREFNEQYDKVSYLAQVSEII